MALLASLHCTINGTSSRVVGPSLYFCISNNFNSKVDQIYPSRQKDNHNLCKWYVLKLTASMIHHDPDGSFLLQASK
jgi:hypothetical protein